MKWVKDTTGRFGQRPHFEPRDLDLDSEEIVVEFLRRRHGQVEYPIATDDLCLLVEENTHDLDYVDLPEGVWGVTEFVTGRKPSVKISRALHDDPRMANPLRTTLTHEFGHVRFHGPMWELQAQTPKLFDAKGPGGFRHESHRDLIFGASEQDWMEWQAGYICGAMLIPFSAARETVAVFRRERKISEVLTIAMSATGELIDLVSQKFQVSRDAARVRLNKLNYVGTDARARGFVWE